MIIHARRLIFVHIQKTGGNAISTALGQNPDCPEKHFFARDLRELYCTDVWNAYFKFAFVRNPWDRLVSWWSMHITAKAREGVWSLPRCFFRAEAARAR
jgi:hypothetical protein